MSLAVAVPAFYTFLVFFFAFRLG